MHSAKLNPPATHVAMESLVSHREYDLHFADPSTASEISMIYLKHTDSSLRAIEQVIRALSCSRTPAPPSIRLEIADNLTGTFTIPQVRGDDVIENNSELAGSTFSVFLAPQETSVDLLHTHTTYPTHEERSHTPGTRRMSLSTPAEPEIFLNFLGPIAYRMNVRATTHATFNSTRLKINEINEKTRNSGAIQLRGVQGSSVVKRSVRPDFGRGRPFNRSSFTRPPAPSRFMPPKSRPLAPNGVLSPSRDPTQRTQARKLSPPQPQQPQTSNQKLPTPPTLPTPPVVPTPPTLPTAPVVPTPPILPTAPVVPPETPQPKKPSPTLRKRPASPEPDPAPKRAKKEHREKRHKKRRSVGEGILSAAALDEISKLQESGCAWSDFYPDICSPDIRADYRRTYDECLPSYKQIRESVESGIKKLSGYKDRLTQLDSQSSEHRRLKKKATRLYQQNEERRKLVHFIHDKLSVVKKQIEQFDRCNQ